MNTSSENKTQQPNIIQAMLAGFNTIANKPYLMLFPIMLDLFLWFGPAWRVANYFQPLIQSLAKLPGLENPEYAEAIKNFQAIWQEIILNFNLALSLRTLPIGVPSLMVSKPAFINPLGKPLIFNLGTDLQIMGFWFLFLIIGYILGSLYFKNISGSIIEINQQNTFKPFIRTFFQIILMPVLLIIILLILSIPLFFLITLVTLISPAISQFILIAIALALIWTLMPLIFTPHAIFLYKQNLIAAMMTSISVVKTTMGKTAWFILMSFVLIEGMDYLWRTPSADNWFLLVGIFGHAFIVTAVTASSFHFFIDATKFAQSIVNNNMKPT